MTNRIFLIIPITIFTGVAVFLAALFTLNHISEKEAQAQQEALEQAQAHARTSLTVYIAAQDQEFYNAQAQAVQQQQADEYFEGIQQDNETLIQSAVATWEDSEDQVLDEEVREDLETAIAQAQQDNEVRLVPTLRAIETNLSTHVTAVDEAVEEWEEEQERIRIEEERLAEERRQAEIRRQEEAQRQQAAQQQQQQQSSSSSSSSSGSSSSSSGSGSSGSSSGGSSSGGSSLHARASAIAAQHGCSSSGIIWDDPRLGSWANGVADWYNNDILLRSSMPEWRFGYVVAHECAHMLQYRVFGGDVGALQRSMNSIYGGSGLEGLEQNADCITQRWGYSAYNYTNSCGGERGRAAQAIINGNKP